MRMIAFRYSLLLSPPAVKDEVMRIRFVKAVRLTDVRVNRLGRWHWTPEQPQPPMDLLHQAPIWTAPEFASLRSQLLIPKVRPVETDTGIAALKQLAVTNQHIGHAANLMLFKAKDAAIPAPVLSTKFRVALILVQPHQPAQGDHPAVPVRPALRPPAPPAHLHDRPAGEGDVPAGRLGEAGEVHAGHAIQVPEAAAPPHRERQ